MWPNRYCWYCGRVANHGVNIHTPQGRVVRVHQLCLARQRVKRRLKAQQK